MTGIWIDTDFGFDDLWALLVLRHLQCDVAGVSLVAGNAPLPQVVANATAAKTAYGFEWPIWQGAGHPLVRSPETAERILGPTGMRSRGMHLPTSQSGVPPQGASVALQNWLTTDADTPRTILALGPLTNIALVLQKSPVVAHRISRIVWMGGSTGAGNHTPKAEFNAVADAEALDCVITSDVPLDIVDLQFCRGVTFNESDMPKTDQLTGDLLGGYLDIALERGRPGMAIYDPLAALAVAAPDTIAFSNCTASVSTENTDSYGATHIKTTDASNTRLAVKANEDLAQLCLKALEKEVIHGHRH